MNHCRKPSLNLNSKKWCKTALSSLDKALECTFCVKPMIFYCASTNIRVVKKSLKPLIPSQNVKPTPTTQLMLEIIFKHKDEEYFPLFYILHMVKTISNVFFLGKPLFFYPKLVISIGFVLGVGL